MNPADFKKLLDEAIKPLKDGQDELSKDLQVVKETQEDHTSRLEALAGDTHDLQEQTKAIWDKVGFGHERSTRRTQTAPATTGTAGSRVAANSSSSVSWCACIGRFPSVVGGGTSSSVMVIGW